MSRNLSSRSDSACAGKNKDGTPCGNKVPTLSSGAVIRRYCHVHSKRRKASE